MLTTINRELAVSGNSHCSNNIESYACPNIGKISNTIKGWGAFLTCGGLVYIASQSTAVLVDKYDRNCISGIKSPICAGYATFGALSGAITIIALVGMLKLALGQGWKMPSLIRNPSVIPNGSEQSLPPSFFQSQQNGGFARYAEDYPQSTHRNPLGNYDSMEPGGGSQSI